MENNYTELVHNEYTEYLYDEICFGIPSNSESAEDIINGINYAIAVDSRPVFLDGISARLTELGTPCTADDREIMLKEIKRRYKEILGFSCPRTVQEWIKGTTPSTNKDRQNHYELCYALEMDFRQTVTFFQKNYLTIPFNVKNKTDAVFMYALYHKKPYSAVKELLEKSKDFTEQETAHTSTSQIMYAICSTDDDEKFLNYLSEHCYNNEHQFQLARKIIREEIEIVHDIIVKYNTNITPDRLGSLTIQAIIGYKYQQSDKKTKNSSLPKRFTESIPNDVTLGKILNDDEVSYELLRKTLMLLKLHNFYYYADNCDRDVIACNLMDFRDELNSVLVSCGFSQIYVCHPFDCLLLYCANSDDPIDMMYCIISSGRN